VVGTTHHDSPIALHPGHRRTIVVYLSKGLWFILNWLSEPFSIEIWEVFPDLTVAMPGDCFNCILCSGKLLANRVSPKDRGFVDNKYYIWSAVLRGRFSGENPCLRVAARRCTTLKTTSNDRDN